MARRALAVFLQFALLCAGGALVAAGAHVRSPALVAFRPAPVLALAAASLVYAAAAWALTRRRRAIGVAALGLGVVALSLGAWREISAARLRGAVLSTPRAELQAVGRHLVVGYVDARELAPLIDDVGVAGVFIARRNARTLSEAALAATIRGWQALRRDRGLPPLWIASDQEGGPVAALTPPLRAPLPLSALTHSGDLVVDEAERVASDLACVGVNLNFAPVVDLDPRAPQPRDGGARISRRAISPDERIVALTARDYCRALDAANVECTLKHFPGVGFATGDVHAGPVAMATLDAASLHPFREIARESTPWIMLSHVSVDDLDPGRPVSASPAAISVLREQWGFDGVLVTDDVSMAAYVDSLDRNAAGSLRAGADVLLVSHDPDVIWRTLDAVLRARRDDPALRAAMERSDARLSRRGPRAPTCRRLAAR
jgi:beta-N-acetylhexosaminidase